MRRRLVVGLGIAGIVAGTALAPTAAGQVPAPTTPPTSRPASPPALPSGYDPAPTPPVAVPERTPAPAAIPSTSSALPPGVIPVTQPSGTQPIAPPAPPSSEIRTAIPADHPWLLKPEHGEYFICVKSYSRPSQPTDDDRGPSALALAEALATEIRDQYRVQAFLFEYISEERKAEAAAIAAARERGRLFAQQLEKYRAQAQLQGMEFLEDRSLKIHYKTINYRDQIAVLVGPFKSDEAARKDLNLVRKWPEPKSRVAGRALMDWGTMVRPGPDGKPVQERAYINPYTTATVVPNPAVARTPAQATENALDPFVVKLNEGRPYSLLNASKGWTLAVKAFSAPVEIVGKDGGNDVMRKPGKSRGADVLAAGAEQAESLAKVLRGMKDKGGNPLGLEAFVLHTRYSSIVTVGQFDGPNDPDLIQKKRLLESMKVSVTEDKSGFKPVMNAPSIFGGNIMPIPIPKKQ